MSDSRRQQRPEQDSGRLSGNYELVVVANRLPVDRSETPDGSVSWQPSPGGLVSALEPVMQRNAGAWIGWTGIAEETPGPFEALGIRLIPVPFDEADVEDFYEGMSNATFWPLYHDVIVRPEFHRHWWDAYRRVNERFAVAAAEHSGRGAVVWVQDYQLQLVPQMLRARRPDLRIGFFNHIPFPPYEIFAQLPWRRQVLDGLLGADLLGFQRPADANNFLRACRRNGLTSRRGRLQLPDEVRFGGGGGGSPRREVRAAAFPISIDSERVAELARRGDVQARARQIREELGNPQTVLLGVDRLDYTKGILHRLQAIEELFADGEIDSSDVVLVQVATPSRERVEEYRRMREDVEVTVGRINGDYGELGRVAVHYLHQSRTREELAALYLASDVLLITALRDGMNLVAKEYVASRNDERGVLVLSEFAGAAIELPQAVLVNPHDIDGLKASIMDAIRMGPKDAQRRMRAMRRRVFEYDVGRWARDFLEAVTTGADVPDGTTAEDPNGDEVLPTDLRAALPSDLVPALENLSRHHTVLIALDFDGVLAPIVEHPETARTLPATQQHLQRLAQRPGVRLALVSGRRLADLEAVASAPDEALLVGSHGAEIRDPHEDDATGAPLDDSATVMLDRVVDELTRITEEHEGTRVETKPVGAVLHTRLAERDVARQATREALDGPATWPGVHLTEGKEVVELSVVDVTKGTALRRLRQETGADAVLYAGDDTTDERAFAVLDAESGDVPVKVGPGETGARYRLEAPEDITAMLALLVELFRVRAR